MRLDATAQHQKRRQLLALEHATGLLYRLGQDGKRFVVELVRPLRPALARQQPRQPFALEQLLCDIEDRAGQAKGFGRLLWFANNPSAIVLTLLSVHNDDAGRRVAGFRPSRHVA